MNLRVWLRNVAVVVRRNTNIIQLFEMAIVERMLKQIRKMAEDSRHSHSTGSGPTAAAGFHAQSDGFADIGLHTTHRAQRIERQFSFRKGKNLILVIFEVSQAIKSCAAD